MTSISSDSPLPTGQYIADVTVSDERGAIWAQALVFLWMTVNTLRFPGDTLALYSLVAAIMVTVVLNGQKWLHLALKAWPIFLVPILGAMSFIWADYPAAAMRFGMFFMLSTISIVWIAMLLTPRQIIRMMFFASIIGSLIVLPSVGVYANGGTTVMGGKNFFAMKAMIGMICGYAVALNSKEPLPLRLIALPFVLLNFYLITRALSATSLVLSVLSLVSMTILYLFWTKIENIRGMRTTVLLSAVGGVAIGVLVFLSMPNNELIKSGLDALGKDTTLTGRTEIWDWGNHVADERPMLGVGLGSFWQYDVGIAQTLAYNDNRPAGWKLTFHNAYLEARVHLGYVGLIAFVFAIIWTLYRNLRQLVLTPKVESGALLICCAIGLSMTMTESNLFGSFHPVVLMFYVGAVATLKAQPGEKIGEVIVSIEAQEPTSDPLTQPG